MSDRYLTTQEVAAHYRVSVTTVLAWIRDKRLPAIDIGTSKRATYRIPESALNRAVQFVRAAKKVDADVEDIFASKPVINPFHRPKRKPQ